MIISFAWTTPALVLGEKDTTRRDWSPKTIASARKIMDRGGTIEAWSKSPRFRGEKVGDVRLTEIIEEEDSRTIQAEEWEREGFHVLWALGATIAGSTALDVFRFWKLDNDQPQTVLRFELVDLTTIGNTLRLEAKLDLRDAGGPVKLPSRWENRY